MKWFLEGVGPSNAKFIRHFDLREGLARSVDEAPQVSLDVLFDHIHQMNIRSFSGLYAQLDFEDYWVGAYEWQRTRKPILFINRLVKKHPHFSCALVRPEKAVYHNTTVLLRIVAEGRKRHLK